MFAEAITKLPTVHFKYYFHEAGKVRKKDISKTTLEQTLKVATQKRTKTF